MKTSFLPVVLLVLPALASAAKDPCSVVQQTAVEGGTALRFQVCLDLRCDTTVGLEKGPETDSEVWLQVKVTSYSGGGRAAQPGDPITLDLGDEAITWKLADRFIPRGEVKGMNPATFTPNKPVTEWPVRTAISPEELQTLAETRAERLQVKIGSSAWDDKVRGRASKRLQWAAQCLVG